MLKKCKYLLGLFVGLIGFTCFSNAILIGEGETYQGKTLQANSSGQWILSINGNSSVFIGCYSFCQSLSWSVNGNPISYSSNGYKFINVVNDNNSSQDIVIDWINEGTQKISLQYHNNMLFSGSLACPECQECEQCPEIDTGSILSGSCDINYCVENGLCPTGTGSRSELVINNIVHEGKPLININIPDYIQWDYAVDENQYDIYVGSGYDQDYIDSVLKINSYRPDNKDFTQIFVSGLTLIFPYIFVALLIVFIWKLLKRIFK